jgi:hypothetical protein
MRRLLVVPTDQSGTCVDEMMWCEYRRMKDPDAVITQLCRAQFAVVKLLWAVFADPG